MTATFPPASAADLLAGLVVPLGGGNLDAMLAAGVITNGSINVGRGARVVIAKTGTLSKLSVYISTTSGNLDLGVYSLGATRTRLYSSGPIPTVESTWVTVNPALAVTAGEQYDVAVAIDNNTATYIFGSFPEGQAGQLPAGYLADGANGALAKLSWSTPGAFPLPDTLAEGSLSLGRCPLIVGAIT